MRSTKLLYNIMPMVSNTVLLKNVLRVDLMLSVLKNHNKLKIL